MKRRLTALILLLSFIFPLQAFAVSEQAYNPVICDDAGLLTEEEIASLTEEMTALCEYGTPILWTTEEYGTASVQASKYLDRQIGRQASGILFMVNTRTRYLYLKAGGDIDRVITSSDCLDITDNVYRLASRGYYAECASSAFGQVLRLMQSERIARPMRVATSALLALTLSLLITFIIVYRSRGKRAMSRRKLEAENVKPYLLAPTTVISCAIIRDTLVRRVVHQSSGGSYRGGGFRGGGGGFRGGGFHGGSGGGHRF